MGLEKNCGFDLHSRCQRGPGNRITDVPGVLVGHTTKHAGDVHTGVTAILPRPSDWFHQKVTAGATVINGFGKTAGLVQVEELGTIEAPILMTNTLSVGAALDSAVRYMLEKNGDIGLTTGTVNCIVTECNDGTLNDIRGQHITDDDVRAAIETAGADFAEGAVGSGSGMLCMGFKGGIGSASRVIEIGGKTYTVGGIVMTNFGGPGSFVIGGRHVGEEILRGPRKPVEDRGSIILVTATDVPLTARQCKRVSMRATAALGRVGSSMGNGSGDVSIAFSTANVIPHYPESPIASYPVLSDNYIDIVFTAAIEALEESIISALWHAETTVGRGGRTARGFREAWETHCRSMV